MNHTNTNGIAKSITFVFHSEAHREEWMSRMGMLKTQTKRLEYIDNRGAINLIFSVKPHSELTQKDEEFPEEDTEDFPTELRGPDSLDKQLKLPF